MVESGHGCHAASMRPRRRRIREKLRTARTAVKRQGVLRST
ncbi:hypothetical protein NSERUTF1_3481 [Nocardia seriolae]|nr:hypothetical protein NSERUTF1_3481 [Nocardia seriolae]